MDLIPFFLQMTILFYVSLFALIVSPKIVVRIKVNDTVTLEPCPIPQVEGVKSWRWVWYRDNEKITPGNSECLNLHESNGSLTVTARMVDVNHLYGCQGIAILPNGTQILGELQPYVISPISKFLSFIRFLIICS